MVGIMNVQFFSMERQKNMWINFDLIHGQTGEWWMTLWKHQLWCIEVLFLAGLSNPSNPMDPSTLCESVWGMI